MPSLQSLLGPAYNSVKESYDFLIKFLKNPIQEVHNLPDWSWERLLIFQVVITGGSGFLAGLVSKSIQVMFIQLFLTPILTMILISVSCLFFYYTFQIFAEKTVPFRALYTNVLFANIPLFIFQIGASYFALLTMIGLAFTALILIVALTARFQIPKKMTVRLILGLYLLFFLIWGLGRLDSIRNERHWNKDFEQAPAVQLGQ